MNMLKRIITVLCVAVVAVSIGAYLMFGWSGSGWKTLSVPTGSMRPTMPPGSLVFVHRVPTSSLKIGDIITYTDPLRPSTTLSHRIIAKTKIGGKIPGFITKGDANKVPDVPIVAGAVIGKVIWHVPHVGYWLLNAKRPLIVLPIVYGFGLLTLVEEVKRVTEYYKSQTPYRLEGYRLQVLPKRSLAKLYTGVSLFLGTVVALSFFGSDAFAALRSNTVSLSPNSITAASTTTSSCGGNGWNSSNVNVQNSTTQTATGNNSSNTNNTGINIGVTQC